jgi:glucan phosphorylase
VRAWEITPATLGYTNHTLVAELLEKWPIPLLEICTSATSAGHLRNQPAISAAGGDEISE